MILILALVVVAAGFLTAALIAAAEFCRHRRTAEVACPVGPRAHG